MIFTKDNIQVYTTDELDGIRFREGEPDRQDKVCLADPSLSVTEIDRFLEANKALVDDFRYDVLSLCHESIAGHNVAFIRPNLLWTDRIQTIKLAVFPLGKLSAVLADSGGDMEAFMSEINRRFVGKFLLVCPEMENKCDKTKELIDYVSENLL